MVRFHLYPLLLTNKTKIMERTCYDFKNADGTMDRIFCTRKEYLFLKMCYGEGLTLEEYQEYKNQ